jgi:hypothetical protein
MVDAALQTQANKLEAVALGSEVTRNDAIASLLDEGRHGAYSASSTIDLSNPKDIDVRTTFAGKDPLLLHGHAQDTEIDLSGNVTSTRTAMLFQDKDGKPVLLEQAVAAIDLQTQLGSVQTRQSSAPDKVAFETQGTLQFDVQDGSILTVQGSTFTDSKGANHATIELTRATGDGTNSSSDIFVAKEGVKIDDLKTPRELTADKMLGVIHTSTEQSGNIATFDVQIQPPRAIAFPALEKST